jgi:hypothetical protein
LAPLVLNVAGLAAAAWIVRMNISRAKSMASRS